MMVVTLSFFAYAGGTLLHQATATAENQYCEHDTCLVLVGTYVCIDTPGSDTGCDMQGGSTCELYFCSSHEGPKDGKTNPW